MFQLQDSGTEFAAQNKGGRDEGTPGQTGASARAGEKNPVTKLWWMDGIYSSSLLNMSGLQRGHARPGVHLRPCGQNPKII